MKTIELTQGKVAMVDDEDFERLSKFKWHASSCYPHHVYYACRGVVLEDGKRRPVSMHREILRAEPGTIIDHADGDGLNNTRANLRFCRKADNVRNAVRKVGKSGYKGVRIVGSRFHAVIGVNSRPVRAGVFDDAKSAALAYDAADRKHHGDFAKLNFP